MVEKVVGQRDCHLALADGTSFESWPWLNFELKISLFFYVEDVRGWLYSPAVLSTALSVFVGRLTQSSDAAAAGGARYQQTGYRLNLIDGTTQEIQK